MGYARSFSRHFPRTLHLAAAPEGSTVSYIGLLGLNQGVATLLAVASLLPEVSFELVGDGPDSAVKSTCRRGPLSPICATCLSPASSQGRLKTTRTEKRHLVRPSPAGPTDPRERYVARQALSRYMAASRPIVDAAKGLAADWLAKVRAGRAALRRIPTPSQVPFFKSPMIPLKPVKWRSVADNMSCSIVRGIG